MRQAVGGTRSIVNSLAPRGAEGERPGTYCIRVASWAVGLAMGFACYSVFFSKPLENSFKTAF